jgi:hypothetical protein
VPLPQQPPQVLHLSSVSDFFRAAGLSGLSFVLHFASISAQRCNRLSPRIGHTALFFFGTYRSASPGRGVV